MHAVLLSSEIREPISQVLFTNRNALDCPLIVLTPEDFLKQVEVFDEVINGVPKIEWTLPHQRVTNSEDFFLINRFLSVPESLFRDFHPHDQEIDKIFKEHKGKYGSPRIHAELRRRGIHCSRYQIENRMKILGLYSGKEQRKPKTPVSFKEGKDLICRDFTAKRPNEKWCADISYIPIRNCFLYLSVILDLYARKSFINPKSYASSLD